MWFLNCQLGWTLPPPPFPPPLPLPSSPPREAGFDRTDHLFIEGISALR